MLKTLFSRQATKAWIAGLGAAITAYLAPIVTDYVTSLTPEQLAEWLASLGFNLPFGVVTVLFGLGAVIWTYTVKNQK